MLGTVASKAARRVRFAAAGAALLASAGLATPGTACAQVLEVGAGGVVRTYDAPALFNRDGYAPIVLRKARPRAGRSTPRGLFDAAAQAELSPALVEAVARQESGLRQGVVSRAGAIGEMQLMPATARELGVDPRDTVANLRGGAAYLRLMIRRYDGDIVRALSAYNAGPGAVDRHGGAAPYAETRAYVAAVLDRLSRRAEEEAEAK